MRYITHIVVQGIKPGNKPLLGRVKDFLLRRKKQFTMPTLQFLRKDGQGVTPLINLESGMWGDGIIELPSKIDADLYYPMIHNTNDYPVMVSLGFFFEGGEFPHFTQVKSI